MYNVQVEQCHVSLTESNQVLGRDLTGAAQYDEILFILQVLFCLAPSQFANVITTWPAGRI